MSASHPQRWVWRVAATLARVERVAVAWHPSPPAACRGGPWRPRHSQVHLLADLVVDAVAVHALAGAHDDTADDRGRGFGLGSLGLGNATPDRAVAFLVLGFDLTLC